MVRVCGWTIAIISVLQHLVVFVHKHNLMLPITYVNNSHETYVKQLTQTQSCWTSLSSTFSLPVSCLVSRGQTLRAQQEGGGGKEEGSGDSEQDAVSQWNVIIKLILRIT